MGEVLSEITVKYGADGAYVVVREVTTDDVGCIIEQLEQEPQEETPAIAVPTEPVAPRGRGRPRKFQTIEELLEKADAYFAECEAQFRPLTYTGLCNALGTLRNVIDEYEDGKHGESFSEPIKMLKQFIDQAYEERLHGPNATGAIFALKNRGWKDSQTHELTGKGGGPIDTKTEHSIPDSALEALGNALVSAKVGGSQ